MSGLLSTVACKKEDYDKESMQNILPLREVMCHDFFPLFVNKTKVGPIKTFFRALGN